ncbi:TonB-dependent receptor [Psychroflexus sediminis]|uniref:Iron complex outermembrane recepter protein n=1 Tax=Psychroflexus sediminis TaxID=470826 RepID=A0A1G7VD91_9FLAO|nr:TonB-dependent receptor [Psychroflexus sediminis]SDG57531.1 iron complex outermembrane recepter protein [Psychroflexus sediminis]
MKYSLRFCVLACFVTLSGYAQLDSIQRLDEVFVVDRQINRFSTGQLVFTLSSSILRDSPGTLTDVLQQNTPIFFKQNGYGMVSSPAFRGTTAQQTAVVWNGFNINSQFNGQTDFNTLLVDGFDEISVRPGGGSVVYGTGAIGGSIHLTNRLRFDGETNLTFSARIGSFSTYQNLLKASTSNEKWSLSFALSRFSSENDYDWPGTSRQNLNAEFEHYNANLSLARKLNQNNKITYYGMYFDGDRNFSLLFPSDPPSSYLNKDHRHLLEWESEFSEVTSVLKLAFFDEYFEYIPDSRTPSPTGARAQTALARYSLFYSYKDFDFNVLSEYNYSSANGDNVLSESRSIASFALLTKHHWKKLTSEVSFRQEYSDVYESPFLFSGGLNYEFSKNLTTKANISKNFRIPTFNDLYWEGSGRTDLLPETSNQLEASVVFSEVENKHQLSFTGHYNDITNLIRWVPNSTNTWQPENVDAVETYGLEAHLTSRFEWGMHNFNFSSLYAYTISENKQTGFQLTYVPKHKFTNELTYKINRFSVNLQNLYNGEVFTRTNNSPGDILEDYLLWNAGMSFKFPKLQNLKISARVRNIGDVAYQTIENRPMPGRHFFIQTLINF